MTGQERAKIFTISTAPDRKVSVTLKSNCVNLFDYSEGSLWTFDLEGRLIGMYVDQINYRRTLDNRFFAKSRKRVDGETFREIEEVSRKRAVGLLRRARSLLLKLNPRLPEEMACPVEKILNMDMSQLEKSGEQFSSTYLPISVLPPDQYMSLVLQVTEGCNYNQCLFCNFYRDRPFRIKSTEETEKHIREVIRFFGQGLKLRRSIFLADANTLVIPQVRLIPILRSVNRLLPQFGMIYSFIDVFTGIRKSAGDFSDLRKLGVKRLYLGVESGNTELLELLNKPQPITDVIELARKVKEGGVNLGIILLAGAGGKRFHSKHVTDSIRLVERIPLGRDDMVYISEFTETSPEYRSLLQSPDIPLASRLEVREMANEFRRGVREVVPDGVAVPIYDIQQFFY